MNWFIVIVAPESDFLAEINAQRRLTLMFCLMAFLVSAGLSYLTSQWVVSPLNRLNQAVRAIAQGDLHQTVQAEHIDELHDLADSFNQMAWQLQMLFGQLRALNQELTRSESRLKEFFRSGADRRSRPRCGRAAAIYQPSGAIAAAQSTPPIVCPSLLTGAHHSVEPERRFLC